MGVWESQSGTDQGNAPTWLLEGKGEALHITNMHGSQKLTDFQCATDGRECATKESGHSAKMSLWYNGSKLVILETRGSEVVKRRFGIVEAGENMDVEIIPIVPTGKTEIEHFRRAKAVSSNK